MELQSYSESVSEDEAKISCRTMEKAEIDCLKIIDSDGVFASSNGSVFETGDFPVKRKKSKEVEDLIQGKLDACESLFQRVGSWPGRGMRSEVRVMLARCERTYSEIQGQCKLIHKQMEERLSAASHHLEANLRNQLSQTVREVVAEVVAEADRGRRESEAQVRIAIETLLGNCLAAKESLVHLHDLCQDHFHMSDPPLKNKASIRRRIKAFFKRRH